MYTHMNVCFCFPVRMARVRATVVVPAAAERGWVRLGFKVSGIVCSWKTALGCGSQIL